MIELPTKGKGCCRISVLYNISLISISNKVNDGAKKKKQRCSSCYCFVARGIVSFVCSIVRSKGSKPFM